MTTLNIIFDRYREMVQASGSGAVNLARFREILKEASQRSILELGDGEPEEQDQEVRIRSMIKLISGGDALSRLERYVRTEETMSALRSPGTGE